MDTGYPINRHFLRYLALSGGVVACFLILVLATNYLVDPYLIHQWDSPLLQRLRPAREKLSPWGKTYAVFKYQPEVLYVGNSRTEVGLPADPSLFGGKRVFNAALSGATLGDSISMLRHAQSISKPDVVVWGVDYWTFSEAIGNSDFDRDLVATDVSYLWRRVVLDLKRSLSFDMTKDAIAVLSGRLGAACRSSLAFRGQKDENCVTAALAERGGTANALVADIRVSTRERVNLEQAIPAFRAAVDVLCRRGVRVLLYVNPLHAITLERFYQQGRWNDLDQWKRQLVEVTSRAEQTGCDVRLFDFSGFNSVTSEHIPQVSGKRDMQNYWEASHYRTEVGRQILAKMMSSGDTSSPLPLPADFGVRLNAGNIEAHLMRIRAERTVYREQHPQELMLLEKWFGDGAAKQSLK